MDVVCLSISCSALSGPACCKCHHIPHQWTREPSKTPYSDLPDRLTHPSSLHFSVVVPGPVLTSLRILRNLIPLTDSPQSGGSYGYGGAMSLMRQRNHQSHPHPETLSTSTILLAMNRLFFPFHAITPALVSVPVADQTPAPALPGLPRSTTA